MQNPRPVHSSSGTTETYALRHTHQTQRDSLQPEGTHSRPSLAQMPSQQQLRHKPKNQSSREDQGAGGG
jgi:hypothetical protein